MVRREEPPAVVEPADGGRDEAVVELERALLDLGEDLFHRGLLDAEQLEDARRRLEGDAR